MEARGKITNLVFVYRNLQRSYLIQGKGKTSSISKPRGGGGGSSIQLRLDRSKFECFFRSSMFFAMLDNSFESMCFILWWMCQSEAFVVQKRSLTHVCTFCKTKWKQEQVKYLNTGVKSTMIMHGCKCQCSRIFKFLTSSFHDIPVQFLSPLAHLGK